MDKSEILLARRQVNPYENFQSKKTCRETISLGCSILPVSKFSNSTPSSSCASTTPTRSCSSSSTTTCLSWSRRSTKKRVSNGPLSILAWIWPSPWGWLKNPWVSCPFSKRSACFQKLPIWLFETKSCSNTLASATKSPKSERQNPRLVQSWKIW